MKPIFQNKKDFHFLFFVKKQVYKKPEAEARKFVSYKKTTCIDTFFFFKKRKKKEKHKNKYSELRKRSPACRLDRHGFKRGLEEL